MKTILSATLLAAACACAQSTPIPLPAPRRSSNTSVEEALWKRKSVREYKNEPLTLAEVSQLLWAAQGANEKGTRTAPSAGALFPLEVYVVAGRVQGLEAGIYKYAQRSHGLTRVMTGDQRQALADAALQQAQIAQGAICLAISGVYARTATRYRDRAPRYVHIEAGHAAQNVFLQAVALNLATVVVGAFEDGRVKRVVGMPEEEQPLYLMPVGRPR